MKLQRLKQKTGSVPVLWFALVMLFLIFAVTVAVSGFISARRSIDRSTSSPRGAVSSPSLAPLAAVAQAHSSETQLELKCRAAAVHGAAPTVVGGPVADVAVSERRSRLTRQLVRTGKLCFPTFTLPSPAFVDVVDEQRFASLKVPFGGCDSSVGVGDCIFRGGCARVDVAFNRRVSQNDVGVCALGASTGQFPEERASGACDPRVFVVMDVIQGGYIGHFLDGVMPRLVNALLIGNQTEDRIAIFIPHDFMSAETIVFLQLMRVDLLASWPSQCFRTVVTLCQDHNPGGLTNLLISRLLRSLFACPPGVKERKELKRIYAGRFVGTRNMRPMAGEAEFAEWLRLEHGFSILSGNESLEEWATAMEGAEVLVGPHGGALTHVFLMNPVNRPMLIELDGFRKFAIFWYTASLLGIDYGWMAFDPQEGELSMNLEELVNGILASSSHVDFTKDTYIIALSKIGKCVACAPSEVLTPVLGAKVVEAAVSSVALNPPGLVVSLWCQCIVDVLRRVPSLQVHHQIPKLSEVIKAATKDKGTARDPSTCAALRLLTAICQGYSLGSLDLPLGQHSLPHPQKRDLSSRVFAFGLFPFTLGFEGGMLIKAEDAQYFVKGLEAKEYPVRNAASSALLRCLRDYGAAVTPEAATALLSVVQRLVKEGLGGVLAAELLGQLLTCSQQRAGSEGRSAWKAVGGLLWRGGGATEPNTAKDSFEEVKAQLVAAVGFGKSSPLSSNGASPVYCQMLGVTLAEVMTVLGCTHGALTAMVNQILCDVAGGTSDDDKTALGKAFVFVMRTWGDRCGSDILRQYVVSALTASPEHFSLQPSNKARCLTAVHMLGSLVSQMGSHTEIAMDVLVPLMEVWLGSPVLTTAACDVVAQILEKAPFVLRFFLSRVEKAARSPQTAHSTTHVSASIRALQKLPAEFFQENENVLCPSLAAAASALYGSDPAHEKPDVFCRRAEACGLLASVLFKQYPTSTSLCARRMLHQMCEHYLRKVLGMGSAGNPFKAKALSSITGAMVCFFSGFQYTLLTEVQNIAPVCDVRTTIDLLTHTLDGPQEDTIVACKLRGEIFKLLSQRGIIQLFPSARPIESPLIQACFAEFSAACAAGTFCCNTANSWFPYRNQFLADAMQPRRSVHVQSTRSLALDQALNFLAISFASAEHQNRNAILIHLFDAYGACIVGPTVTEAIQKAAIWNLACAIHRLLEADSPDLLWSQRSMIDLAGTLRGQILGLFLTHEEEEIRLVGSACLGRLMRLAPDHVFSTLIGEMKQATPEVRAGIAVAFTDLYSTNPPPSNADTNPLSVIGAFLLNDIRQFASNADAVTTALFSFASGATWAPSLAAPFLAEFKCRPQQQICDDVIASLLSYIAQEVGSSDGWPVVVLSEAVGKGPFMPGAPSCCGFTAAGRALSAGQLRLAASEINTRDSPEVRSAAFSALKQAIEEGRNEGIGLIDYPQLFQSIGSEGCHSARAALVAVAKQGVRFVPPKALAALIKASVQVLAAKPPQFEEVEDVIGSARGIDAADRHGDGAEGLSAQVSKKKKDDQTALAINCEVCAKAAAVQVLLDVVSFIPPSSNGFEMCISSLVGITAFSDVTADLTPSSTAIVAELLSLFYSKGTAREQWTPAITALVEGQVPSLRNAVKELACSKYSDEAKVSRAVGTFSRSAAADEPSLRKLAIAIAQKINSDGTAAAASLTGPHPLFETLCEITCRAPGIISTVRENVHTNVAQHHAVPICSSLISLVASASGWAPPLNLQQWGWYGVPPDGSLAKIEEQAKIFASYVVVWINNLASSQQTIQCVTTAATFLLHYLAASDCTSEDMFDALQALIPFLSLRQASTWMKLLSIETITPRSLKLAICVAAKFPNAAPEHSKRLIDIAVHHHNAEVDPLDALTLFLHTSFSSERGKEQQRSVIGRLFFLVSLLSVRKHLVAEQTEGEPLATGCVALAANKVQCDEAAQLLSFSNNTSMEVACFALCTLAQLVKTNRFAFSASNCFVWRGAISSLLIQHPEVLHLSSKHLYPSLLPVFLAVAAGNKKVTQFPRVVPFLSQVISDAMKESGTPVAPLLLAAGRMPPVEELRNALLALAQMRGAEMKEALKVLPQDVISNLKAAIAVPQTASRASAEASEAAPPKLSINISSFQ